MEITDLGNERLVYPIDEIKSLTIKKVSTYSKEDIIELANSIIKEIEEDGADAMEVFAELQRFNMLADTIFKSERIKNMIESDIYRSEKRSTVVRGVKISLAETTRYDYSNDQTWVELNNQLKEREAFLKGLNGPMTMLDEETGETTRVFPPVKKGSSSIRKELL